METKIKSYPSESFILALPDRNAYRRRDQSAVLVGDVFENSTPGTIIWV
jgi:hypothetical protein